MPNIISSKEIRQATEAGAKLVQMVSAVRYRAKTDQVEMRTSWCTLLVDRQRIPELAAIPRSRMKEIYASLTGIHIQLRRYGH